MKFSVLIPAYNSAATIAATVNSVLSQTLTPSEVLIFNDGSTDNTSHILAQYKSRITVFQDSNHGLSYGRNYMGHHAQGDVLAFLDSDDIWHSRYLETQQKLIKKHPDAVAYFTEHEDIVGWGQFEWSVQTDFDTIMPEVIQPLVLLRRSNETPLKFQMSCCCVPKHIFSQLEPEPFRINGAEDTFFNALLALLGPVVHTSAKPVAYRITERSASANRLKGSLDVLDVFEALEPIYKEKADIKLYTEFQMIYAARRRNCAKYLMGSGRVSDARAQFKASLKRNSSPLSILKSMGLFSASFLPVALQPKWPAPLRNQPRVDQQLDR